MRDILVTAIVFGSLPLILTRPWVGILVYSWIGYMNPHRLTYGFAYDFPFAQIVALVTIGAWLVSRERKTIPLTPVSVLIVMLTIWTCVTMLFALSADDYTMLQWEKTMKILLITFLTLAMFGERQRLEYLMWAIALSLGFFGIKGGIFTILTGGGSRVWGPAGSFIEDNNQFAVAMIMAVPVIRYLQLQATQRWLRQGLLGAQVLSIFAIVGTQSRGALLGLGALMFAFWLLSKHKVMLGIGTAVVLVGVLSFMPQTWWDRMSTIETYEMDESAQGRLDQWAFAIELANKRVVGGGFGVFGDQEVRDRYMNDGALARAAHSAFFQVLGEHGWVGLILFLLIMGGSFRTCSWVKKRTKGVDDLKWAWNLATMLQCSIVGFAVGSAFVNLAFFDLYWHVIAIVILLGMVVQKELAKSPDERAAEAQQKAQTAGFPLPALPLGSFMKAKPVKGSAFRR